MTYSVVIPVVDTSVRALCYKACADHPRGCPNYGKRVACPPLAPLWFNVFEGTAPTWVIWNRFPLGDHVARMRKKHPKWSDRQCFCCLYWQGTARKQLKFEIDRLWQCEDLLGYDAVTCPEAMGINVTTTMQNIGIDLEWPPRQWAYQIALAGRCKGIGV